MRALSCLALCAALSACGDDDGPAVADGGGHDASQLDGGPVGDDAGADDDAGPGDAGTADAGRDAGRPDSGPPDSGVLGPAPAFRNPVDLSGSALATEALRILGAPEAGGSGSCGSCHGITRARMREWHTMSDFAWRTCFTDLEVRTVDAAREVVSCLRAGATSDDYHPETVGVFSSAARLDWYPFVFERALGAGWEEAYEAFADQAGMPIEPTTHTPLTQAQFDVVAEWFLRGLPNLHSVLPADPPPTACEPLTTPAVAAHASEMTTMGWGAVNLDNDLLMYGCAGAPTTRDCMNTKPRVTDWEVAGTGVLRQLYTYTGRSSFWTRSSADGRFVAHGGGDGGRSTFIDLQESRIISANASYDPSFFPDNSGFVFQGGGAHFCEQSVLMTGATSILFNEPQCETNNVVGLYEHVGASLAGGDYWAVHGAFTSDNGSGSNPSASFSSSSLTSFTRLINDGSGFAARETIDVATPYEGDAVLSPSARLVVTRIGGAGGAQIGFVLRRIDASRRDDGTLTLDAPVVGRYCIAGGKPAISFDERWMVLHRYESSRADVWLVDLVTGASTRVTNMPAGSYALFPHFRSDGWIYFIVRNSSGEQVIASDAALVLAP